MEMRKDGVPGSCSLLVAVLLSTTACQGGSLSAVERIEQHTREPTVRLVGDIDIESGPVTGDTLQITLEFYELPDTTVQETHVLQLRTEYYVLFFHDRVCSWVFSITLADGRRSERQPVSLDPPVPCVGLINGPAFYFP